MGDGEQWAYSGAGLTYGAALLALGSLWATSTYLGVTTDTGGMFANSLKWKQRSDELSKLFPQNSDLIVAVIDSEAQGVLDRLCHHLAGNALSPITVGEESVDDVEIEAGGVGSEGEVMPGKSDVHRYRKALQKKFARCHPSMYLYGVSPVV